MKSTVHPPAYVAAPPPALPLRPSRLTHPWEGGTEGGGEKTRLLRSESRQLKFFLLVKDELRLEDDNVPSS